MFHYPTLLQRGDTLFIAYSRTYLDRNVAPHPLAVDGIWLAKVDLSQLHVPGPPVPLFDPRACKSTACLLNKGIAGAGPPQGGNEGTLTSHHSSAVGIMYATGSCSLNHRTAAFEQLTVTGAAVSV
eukprot:3786835-Pyramimonas_sp.AAC.2